VATSTLRVRGNPEPRTNPFPLTATITAVTGSQTHFAFQDCIATYVDEDRDKDHPDGYGRAYDDKYGDRHKSYSEVRGHVFGMTTVVIYPQQFGIDCPDGTCFRFVIQPQAFVDGCVRAIAEELCPPEYVI
jgi:hypothetical protein